MHNLVANARIVFYDAAGGTGIPATSAAAPPGSKGLLLLFAWGLWIAFLVCIGGIAKAGGHLAWAGIKPGGQGNHGGAGLMWGTIGAIITATAAAIVTAVVAVSS